MLELLQLAKKHVWDEVTLISEEIKPGYNHY